MILLLLRMCDCDIPRALERLLSSCVSPETALRIRFTIIIIIYYYAYVNCVPEVRGISVDNDIMISSLPSTLKTSRVFYII